MDVLFSFPTLILAIGIAAMLGPGLNNAALAIAVVYVPLFSRVARGPVIAEREKDHVAAAQGLGAGWPRIVFRHILPNVLAPLIVQASVSLAFAILIEASLSYLGLGTQPPDPSWGTMLNEGRTYLETAPWMSIFPGLAIMLAVFGFNLLGRRAPRHARPAAPRTVSASPDGAAQPARRANFWKQWGVRGASRSATPVALTTSPT